MSIKRIPGNVYAILRFDDYHDSSASLDARVSVVKVVPELATAEAEVDRLNVLNGAKRCRYVWRATRLADRVPDEELRDE